jgi:hypothetical protein
MVGEDVSQSQLFATKTHIKTYHKTSPLHDHFLWQILSSVFQKNHHHRHQQQQRQSKLHFVDFITPYFFPSK